MFGDPDQPPEVPCSRGPASSVSLASWQHLGQGIWVFGAHCSTGAACSVVTAVGLMTQGDLQTLQCAMWYEGSRLQLQGILTVNTDSLNITTFTCESKYPDKRPYSLAIYTGKGIYEFLSLFTFNLRMGNIILNLFQFRLVGPRSSLLTMVSGPPWVSAFCRTP